MTDCLLDDFYRALVVDDEVQVRQLTMRALTDEGFRCHAAADGAEALQMADENRYDLVVADLRMPRAHGHALAAHLLLRDIRPVIIVVTGLLEPQLTKDLLARGVDDIVFKPIDYKLFAIKAKALVKRAKAKPVATL